MRTSCSISIEVGQKTNILRAHPPHRSHAEARAESHPASPRPAATQSAETSSPICQSTDGGARTHTSLRIPDFESSASANSATSASLSNGEILRPVLRPHHASCGLAKQGSQHRQRRRRGSARREVYRRARRAQSQICGTLPPKSPLWGAPTSPSPLDTFPKHGVRIPRRPLGE